MQKIHKINVRLIISNNNNDKYSAFIFKLKKKKLRKDFKEFKTKIFFEKKKRDKTSLNNTKTNIRCFTYIQNDRIKSVNDSVRIKIDFKRMKTLHDYSI